MSWRLIYCEVCSTLEGSDVPHDATRLHTPVGRFTVAELLKARKVRKATA